jgi:hypothetical protein
LGYGHRQGVRDALERRELLSALGAPNQVAAILLRLLGLE